MQARTGDPTGAKATAAAISNPFVPAEALRDIAQARRGDPGGARATVANVNPPSLAPELTNQDIAAKARAGKAAEAQALSRRCR